MIKPAQAGFFVSAVRHCAALPCVVRNARGAWYQHDDDAATDD